MLDMTVNIKSPERIVSSSDAEVNGNDLEDSVKKPSAQNQARHKIFYKKTKISFYLFIFFLPLMHSRKCF